MKMKNIVLIALGMMAIYSTPVMAGNFLKQVGRFDIPTGQKVAGPAFPGQNFEFEVVVHPGERLGFTSMFGASNDWFFSTAEGFSYADLMSGTIDKKLIVIFDAGTEVDQNPANAPDSAAHQPAPNTGLSDPVAYVRTLSQFSSFSSDRFVKITTTSLGNDCFRVKVSVLTTSSTPLSPGVFWVTTDFPVTRGVFRLREASPPNGLEQQAEDGNNELLYNSLKALL